MANVGVIGAGSWGTALSVLLADNGHHVTIWSIDEKEVEMLDKKVINGTSFRLLHWLGV